MRVSQRRGAIAAGGGASAVVGTIGHNTIYASAATVAGGAIHLANQSVCPTTGTLTKISLYLDNLAGGSTQQIQAAIWADSAGSPGARVDYGAAVTLGIGAAAAWVDFPVIVGAAVTSGLTYWIGYEVQAASTIKIYRQAGAATASKYKSTGTTPPTDPFGAVSGNDANDYSAYATFTA